VKSRCLQRSPTPNIGIVENASTPAVHSWLLRAEHNKRPA
jgi:hypothetical protein